MQQRHTDAEAILVRLQPTSNGEATSLRSRLDMERGDHPRAIESLNNYLAHHPEAVPAQRLLSYAALQQGRDPAAGEQALSRLIQLAPHDAEARDNLSILRRQNQNGNEMVAR